jgi:hypothetical protein
VRNADAYEDAGVDDAVFDDATIILDALLVIRANTAEILDLLREENGEEEEENT